MDIKQKKINLDESIISIIPEDSLFFDIETLGLSKRTNPIYLIGTFSIVDNSPLITMFFADSVSEEPEILSAFCDHIKEYKTLITFNGENFDVPFVKERGMLYNINFPFDNYNRIDMYLHIRPFKKLLSLPRLNQKTIEEFMGIYRDDKYDGGQLIKVYKEYEKTRDKSLKDLLLLHNFDDIQGMVKIFPLLSYAKLSGDDYHIEDIDMGYPEEIIFKASLPTSIPKPIRVLSENYHIKAEGKFAYGSLSLNTGEYKHFFKNINDYVYLPLEDMIVPKSLSASIPRDRKEKPCRENCCIKANGTYFMLPNSKRFNSCFNLSDKTIYKQDYSHKDCFIKIDTKKDSSESSELSELIIALLKYSFS